MYSPHPVSRIYIIASRVGRPPLHITWIQFLCPPASTALIFNYFYRPQRSWGKVIFSQASVILLTGGGCFLGGVLPPGGYFLQGGASSRGRGASSGGVGGASSFGGVLPLRGASSLGGPGGDPPGTATAAGGTHPTGMHSCLTSVYLAEKFLIPISLIILLSNNIRFLISFLTSIIRKISCSLEYWNYMTNLLCNLC